MSASRGSIASGALLVLAGVWLLLQTLVGDLPKRLVGLSGKTGAPPAPNYGSNQTPGLQSTNQSITSTLNPNPPAQTAPFLSGLPGTSSFQASAP